MSESQHSADTQEMILKILDLSHTDARAALLILAASPYKKYREAAAKALRMVDWDNGERTASLVLNAEQVRIARDQEKS